MQTHETAGSERFKHPSLGESMTQQDPYLDRTSMDEPSESGRSADLRDYLAAERTFLEWIRTGLALMGFGFVVARFGLRDLRKAPTSSY